MTGKQSALITDLKEFLTNLQAEEYAKCRKKAQLFKKSYRKEWGSLIQKCTEKACNYQKQNKSLQEMSTKYFEAIKKNFKSSHIKQIKNGKVIKQEEKNSMTNQLLILLQGKFYGQALKQSKQQYQFLYHLVEYKCLLNIWQSAGEQNIEEPQIKSQFYRNAKKIFMKDAKKENQLGFYASKICSGQRLQPQDEPQYLSQRCYGILLNLQQSITNRINYQNQRDDDTIVGAIKILKQLYRQFFQKQFNPQTLQVICLQRCIGVLRNDLNKWKQKWNQQKQLNKDEIIKAKMESLSSRNDHLEKKIKLIPQKLIKILDAQICMGLDYPENEEDIQNLIDCITENNCKLETLIKKNEQLLKQAKLQITYKKSKNNSSFDYDEKSNALQLESQQRDQYQYQIADLKNQLQKLSNTINSFRNNTQLLQTKLGQVEANLQQKNKQYEKLVLQLTQSRGQVDNFQSKMKKQTGYIRQKQIKENELLQSISVLKDQKRSTQGFMQSNLQSWSTKSVESKSVCVEIQRLKLVIEELKKEQSRITIHYNQLLKASKQKEEKLIQSQKKQKQKYDNLSKEFDELQERLNAQLQHLSQTYQVNNKLEVQFNEMKSRSQILCNPFQQKEKSGVTLTSDLQINLKNQIDIKQKQVQRLKRQKTDLKNRINELQGKNKKLIRQQQTRIQKYKISQRQYLENTIKDLEKERQTRKTIQQQLANAQSQLLLATEKTKKYQDKNQSLIKQISLLKEAESAKIHSPNLYKSNLFNFKGIFEDSQQRQQQYLIKTLESRIGKILKAKLLYFYDPLNKTNFHRYVDNHKNLLVIVKTLFGKLIAGFSQIEINPRGTKVGFGLVMSLWKQCTFQILPDKKPVTYDDYYIIFGNSQIRLRSQEDKVFSNFGIANGFFRAGASKIEDLLGERERQVDIIGYEFYEVIFSQ